MTFKQAYHEMRAGKKIRLPEWGGYWYWNDEVRSIVIHTQNGDELDIRDTQDVSFTFSFIIREDWEVIS